MTIFLYVQIIRLFGLKFMLTVLCKSTVLGMRLAMVCVVCYVVRDWLWITWEDSCRACEFVEEQQNRIR